MREGIGGTANGKTCGGESGTGGTWFSGGEESGREVVMPHVIIKMYPGRTPGQKKELADRIVRAMEETIGAKPESISLSYEEVKPEDWHRQVVKPDIEGKKDRLFIAPGHASK